MLLPYYGQEERILDSDGGIGLITLEVLKDILKIFRHECINGLVFLMLVCRKYIILGEELLFSSLFIFFLLFLFFFFCG